MNVAGLRWRAVAAARTDAGFSLMEVVVALGIILVVMTFSLAFFIRSVQGTALQQQRQAAVAVADQAMEKTRSVPAKNLFNGRDGSRVDAQWASPGSVVTSQSVKVIDPAATPTSMPHASFGTTSLVNNVSYLVRTFVDGCYLDSTSVCGPTNVPTSHLMYRVTVEVRWQPKADQSCSGAGEACAYVVSTLRDPSPDVPFIQTGS